MTGEPARTETASRTEVAADAALVVAAVARMQTADQVARARLARLRLGLGEMANAIGRAKATAASAGNHDNIAQTVDIMALLDEFEHLVDGLIEVAAGPADQGERAVVTLKPAASAIEPMPQAESVLVPEPEAVAPLGDTELVPTVSGVVSRLDPEQDVTPPPEPDLREIAVAHAAAGPSVEMLKSLVEALNASIPAEVSPAEPALVEPALTETTEAQAPETAQAAQVALIEAAAPEPQAAADAPAAAVPGEPGTDVPVEFHQAEPPQAVTETIEPAAQTAPPQSDAPSPTPEPWAATAAVALLDTIEPVLGSTEIASEAAQSEAEWSFAEPEAMDAGNEVELLARLEQMGEVAILPPELGAAVIFSPREDSTELVVPQADDVRAVDPEIAPQPEAAAEPDVVAADPITEAVEPIPFEPVARLAATGAEAAAATSSAPETVLEAQPAALMEPAAPEPGAETIPQPTESRTYEGQPAAEQPVPNEPVELLPVDLDAVFDPDVCLFGSDDEADTPAGPTDTSEAPNDGNGGAAPQAAAKPGASADPLVPIKAMSQEERIALFS